MEKPKQEEIPRSIIKGSGVIYADLSSLNGKGKVLLMNPTCGIIGLGDLPYMLVATPQFSVDKLNPNIKMQIHEVKKVIIQSTFSLEQHLKNQYCKIPEWLIDYKKIESLRLDHVDLDNMDHIKNLPIQHLILDSIRYSDEIKLIDAIKQFKHLKEISYDRSLSAELVHSIEKLNLKLTPVTD